MKYSLTSKTLALTAILLIGHIVSLTIRTSEDVPSAILEVMKDKDPETFYRAFLIAFQKENTYKKEQFQRRFNTFKESLKNIEKLNQKYAGKTKFGITALSDISEEEYFQPMKEYYQLNQENFPEVTHTVENKRFEPIDWRNSIPFAKRPGWGRDGVQHWHYALLFNYEAANAIATKTYTALSISHVMGCLNVNQPYTFMNDRGLLAEKDFPTPKEWWNIRRDRCEDSNTTGIRYKVSANAYTNLEGRPENRLIRRYTSDLYSFLKRGPVFVRFSASWNAFQNYKGGIFVSDEPCESCNKCNRYRIGLLVGYGIDSATNTDYWIIKLHKGDDWGEDGSYMRLARNDSALNYGLTCYWEQPMA